MLFPSKVAKEMTTIAEPSSTPPPTLPRGGLFDKKNPIHAVQKRLGYKKSGKPAAEEAVPATYKDISGTTDDIEAPPAVGKLVVEATSVVDAEKPDSDQPDEEAPPESAATTKPSFSFTTAVSDASAAVSGAIASITRKEEEPAAAAASEPEPEPEPKPDAAEPTAQQPKLSYIAKIFSPRKAKVEEGPKCDEQEFAETEVPAEKPHTTVPCPAAAAASEAVAAITKTEEELVAEAALEAAVAEPTVPPPLAVEAAVPPLAKYIAKIFSPRKVKIEVPIEEDIAVDPEEIPAEEPAPAEEKPNWFEGMKKSLSELVMPRFNQCVPNPNPEAAPDATGQTTATTEQTVTSGGAAAAAQAAPRP